MIKRDKVSDMLTNTPCICMKKSFAHLAGVNKFESGKGSLMGADLEQSEVIFTS